MSSYRFGILPSSEKPRVCTWDARHRKAVWSATFVSRPLFSTACDFSLAISMHSYVSPRRQSTVLKLA